MRRAEQARQRRRTMLIGGGIVAAVVVVASVLFVVARSGDDGGPTADSDSQQIVPTSVTGPETVEEPPETVADTSAIEGVLAWSTKGYPGDGRSYPGAVTHEHVEGPVSYAVVPPVGGPHSSIWMNAGVYTDPVPAERAVHNMEHGGVWIVYDPDLAASQVAELTAFVHGQSMIEETAEVAEGVTNQANRYIDLSPWKDSDLPSPIVISSWGHQLRLTSPTDPRLQRFVDTFRNSEVYTPEFGAPVDGVPILTGGRPASDGSRQPNPEGDLS